MAVRILNTANQNEITETNFAVTKAKKSLETGRKEDCKEEFLQTRITVTGAGCSGEERFRAGAILNYYLKGSLHFLRGAWGSCFLLATERFCASHSLKLF